MAQSTLLWGLILILGFPLVNVVLGEAISRLQHGDIAQFLRKVRRWILPLLAILLVMKQFLGVKESDLLFQIVETLLWVAIIYTSMSLLNVVLTTRRKEKFWQIYVPNLLFQSARVLVILSIAAYILAQIWKVNLGNVLTALGVGSLVMALALQDTLSNLVSGFLLIFESPFKVGDWVRIQNIEGEVMEINWRAVRLKTRDRDIIIIPNGVLGKDTIYNYTMIDPLHAERVFVRFSHNYPPNQIKRVLMSASLSTPGIVSKPEPEVRTKSYEDFAIQYEIKFFIIKFLDLDRIRNELMTRIYYAVKRNNIKIPLPAAIEYKGNNNDLERDDTHEEILVSLPKFSYFVSLARDTINALAANTTLEYYGAGEVIISSGEFDTGFYIILEGSVVLSVTDIQNQSQEIVRLSQGDFFGEMVLLRRDPSLVSVTVIDDLKTLVIEPDAVIELAHQNTKFAVEMNHFIEQRRKAARLARGTENLSSQSSPPNGKESSQLVDWLINLSDS